MQGKKQRSFLCVIGFHQFGKGELQNPYNLFQPTRTMIYKCTRPNCCAQRTIKITYGSI